MDIKEVDKLQEAINEGLEDIKHGRLTPNQIVMDEIKRKYNYPSTIKPRKKK